MARLLFLGTGSSMGIPVIGCKCGVCSSKDPCNKRFRPSALLQIQNKKILLDAGPDLRDQALFYGLDHLDGLIITHIHYDHIGGLDEIRAFNFLQKGKIPCLLSQESKKDIEARHYHLFHSNGSKAPSSQLEFQELEKDCGSTTFLGISLNYVSYVQAGVKVNGFRFQDLAYITDIREYDESIFSYLKGIKTLVISALRDSQSFMHFSLEEGIAFAKKIGTQSTYFTHIAHELDHKKTNQKLPNNIQLAYDGLEVEFEYN